MDALCTVGYPGAGKSVVKSVAEDLGIPTIEMGDFVREKAREAGVGTQSAEDTPSEAIGKWINQQRREHGDEIVAEWTVEAARDSDADCIVIDGVRAPHELDVFQDEFDSVHIVHIAAGFETRLQRLRDRGRAGEETFTETKLQERDAREDERGVADVVEMADTQLDNGAAQSIESLKADVRTMLDDLGFTNS